MSSSVKTAQLLTIVVPCYNESDVIAETASQLIALSSTLPRFRFEFIFVDDGSKDDTHRILKALAAKDARIKIVRFSRNFGHQIAVSAGLDAAAGDAVIIIDADLQDPPDVIVEMISKWEDGNDVVYGTRMNRPGESNFKLATAHAFYRFFNLLSETPIPVDTGDFRLISRNVVDTIRAMPERERFVRGMVSWAGFRQVPVHYNRSPRAAGQTKYPLVKMLRFAINGLLSFSAVPLRIAAAIGAISASLAALGIIYAIFLRLFTSIWVEGWTALMLAVLFVGGIQLICLGIIGEYIARVYTEVKSRPLYVVQEYVGFDHAPGHSKSPVRVTT